MNASINSLPKLLTGGFLYVSLRLRIPKTTPKTVTEILTPSKIDLGKKWIKVPNLRHQKTKWKTEIVSPSRAKPPYPNYLIN